MSVLLRSSMKKLLFAAIPVALLACFTLLNPSLVSAQSGNDGGQALEIAPPVVTLTLKPGQTITTQISLRDVSDGPLLVTGEINDFVANEESEDGAPRILMNDDAATEDNPYSMRSWIDPLKEILLEPQEVQNLPVTIRVPDNASPGGYFGVVRFTATAPELEGQGVSLSASLGSLLLITVSGDAKESMEIVDFNISKDNKVGSFFESAPIEFSQRLKNTGNIHLKPAGQVAVTDMFGKKVAAVNINLPPGNVLPNSIRKFTQPLDESVIGNKQLFGRYTATLTVNYGSGNQPITQTVTFWVVPYKLIGAGIVLLVGGFILLRFMIRHYNRRIISQAQKSKRK